MVFLMGKSSKNSKESKYSSELEKYMEDQEDLSEDLNLDNEYDFQTSSIGHSRLDDYVGIDDEKDDEEINYCSICGAELKKFKN